ncbi:MAG: PQQ-binding-like beta-propeller repeat protein [Planctomycetota bacterium]
MLADRKNMQALSTDTGRRLWAIGSGAPRGELFVANDLLWHWQGEQVVGRSLQSGQVVKKVATDDVFTPGHHFRCYQSKATENFLITPNRGAEFISLTGAENTQNDWARGPCRYGIVPCNGLLYVPPNPCFCYPGVKITGFNALAPAASKRGRKAVTAPRLQRGTAYGRTTDHASASKGALDWPTYRHDARRTGTTPCAVSPQLSMRWEVPLKTGLTPPVVASERVFVAAKDEHTLHAMDIADGRKVWQFTADGRIDSPPTIHTGLVLLGCADGYVYCLQASDGKLVWRFRAARTESLIVAGGQLESPWRVHGSVLVEDDLAYFTAGRSSYLDGGIYVFALDPQTGKLRHEARLDTWARTRKDAEHKPFIAGYHMEGACSDILVGQGGYIYLGQAKFNRRLIEQDVPYIMPAPNEKATTMNMSGLPYVVADEDPDEDYEIHQREWLERTQKHLLQTLRQAYGDYSLGHRQMGLHVFSTSGFLDDSWFNRTYWMYSATWPGYYLGHRGAKTGQLLVVGPEKTYAVQSYPSRNLQSPLFTPGQKGYLLFADNNDNEPVLDDRTRGTTKGWGFTRQAPPVWHEWLPVRIRAMALAGDNLFIAGPPDIVDPADPMAAFEGRLGGLLWTVSAVDGKKRAEYKLEAPPVSDGLIAAQGRLFASLRDGRLVCLD